MSLPELLSGAIGDEEVIAEVPLGGDDVLAVTPTRTLVYRADGLLSDESVEEYGHDAERIAVSTGRRKSKIVLGYGLDGDETLSLPTKRVDDALHPILAGVLSATGVTEPGESVRRTFRFSELTLVVTDSRLVKHVGSAVWDEEFEEFPYANLTDLDFEEGTVATAVVLAHGGRSERFKAPNESARAVRETLVNAVCAFHGVDSLEEFRVTAADDADDADASESADTTDFGEGPDPLSASPVADAEANAEANAEADARSGTEATTGAESAGDPTVKTGTGTSAAAEAGAPDATGATETAESTEPTESTETIETAGAAAGDTARDDGTRSTGAGSATDTPGGQSTGASGGAEETPGSAGSDPLEDAFGGEPSEPETGSDTVSDEPDAFEGSPFESAGVEDDDLATEVASLRQAVEAQSERLDRQSELIERLIEELRRGR